MKMGVNVLPPIEAIPTGSLALDLALGIGGIPRGRITEIFDLNHPEKLPWHSISSLKRKKEEERLLI